MNSDALAAKDRNATKNLRVGAGQRLGPPQIFDALFYVPPARVEIQRERSNSDLLNAFRPRSSNGSAKLLAERRRRVAHKLALKQQIDEGRLINETGWFLTAPASDMGGDGFLVDCIVDSLNGLASEGCRLGGGEKCLFLGVHGGSINVLRLENVLLLPLIFNS
jgi:hypothetical protein